MDENDRNKTRFSSHYVPNRLVCFQLGLKISYGTFRDGVYVILSNMKWYTALLYLENKVSYSKTVNENIFYVKHAR